MAKLYIMVGLPGSGKSTYAKKLSKEINAEIISSDDIRIELFGIDKKVPNSKKVFKEMRKRIYSYLSQDINVICDATNVSIEKRASFLARDCSELANSKIAIVVNRDIDTCKKQNVQREESQRVPVVAIYTLAKNFVFPTLNEGFDEIKEI